MERADGLAANICYLATDIFQTSLQGRQHLISLKAAASAPTTFPRQPNASPTSTMMSKGKRMQLAVSGGWDEWETKSHHWSFYLIVKLVSLGGFSPMCKHRQVPRGKSETGRSALHPLIGFGGGDCFNSCCSLASVFPNHSHCWTCGADKNISLKH